MSDVFLVVLVRPEGAPALLNAARRLTELVDCARINVLAVHERSAVPPLSAEAVIEEADAFVIERSRQHERVAALKTAFGRWAAEAGKLATISHWVEAEGSAAMVVGERGSRADMIVAGAPGENEIMELDREKSSAAFGPRFFWVSGLGYRTACWFLWNLGLTDCGKIRFQ